MAFKFNFVLLDLIADRFFFASWLYLHPDAIDGSTDGLLPKYTADQRATMMDILSENSKKEYPKSVTELLRLEGKMFMQGVCYFINKIPKFIFKKVNALNINSILLRFNLRDIRVFKNRGSTSVIE
jgi:hypothetical protein